ncbi:MAG: hypothetical protein JXR95_12180 [Deltaproteobacteria bacterium]|nr:hypothetical protein [Deltaproteobacteria bacterium]
MFSKFISIYTIITTMLISTSSYADNNSWFTLGFAFHTVKSNLSDANSPFGEGVNMGWQLRARLFRSIHIEFDYNMSKLPASTDNQLSTPASITREPLKSLTISLDLAHTAMGTPYILAGAGKGESTEEFSGNVYYAGMGYELPFWSNWAFSTEVRFLGPSITDVQTYISTSAEKKSSEEIPTVRSFYNSNQYQVFVSLRYYF